MSTAALRDPPPLDVDGFLAFLDTRPGENWELHWGVPRAMVGSTYRHGLIGDNILVGLRPQASRHGCRANSGFLVDIGDHSAYEPDVLVTCVPIEPTARRTDQPAIVFEVLSPSTMDFDRADKARNYRAIPSLQQLVFVYQDSLRVESWLRRDEGWSEEATVLLRPEDSLVPAIGGSLPLGEIYADTGMLPPAP